MLLERAAHMKRFIATVLMMLVAGMAHAATQVSPATSAVPAATSASGTRERPTIPNPLLQQTISSDQTVYYGPPFYCDDYWFGDCGLHATLQGAIQGWWAAYKAYWGVNDSNCSYYYTLTGSDGAEKTFVLMYVHGSACAGGPSGIYGTAHPVKLQVSIFPGPVWIPLFSSVDKHNHVLTWVHLGLNLDKNGQPVSGMYVPLKSSRGKDDTISDDQATNGDGVAGASVSTRDQPGNSTISSASSTIETAEPADISWLPADYMNKFLLTCYDVSNENNYLKTKLVTAPGIPNKKYHEGFLKDTAMQGTGKATDGSYVKYTRTFHGRYYYKVESCPWTRIHVCAKDNVTVAVDPNVVPMKSNITISGKGDRIAQDTGGRIKGYHIDLFYGTRHSACLAWGKDRGRKHDVILESYGQ